jgi:hypothetical protein
LTRKPATAEDAHRPLGKEHDLAATLSHVEHRQVTNDYTIRWDGKFYRIDRQDVRAGMRKAVVRVEQRLDATIAVRFQAQSTQSRRSQNAGASGQAQAQARLDEQLLVAVWPLSAPGG